MVLYSKKKNIKVKNKGKLKKNKLITNYLDKMLWLLNGGKEDLNKHIYKNYN